MKIAFKEFINLVIRNNQSNRPLLLKSCKIIYFKSGSGQLMINSDVYRFTAGMYAIVPSNELYQDIVTEETEEMICELLPEADENELPRGIYYDADNSIFKQFEKILTEYRSRECFHNEFLDLYCAELYYLVLRSLRSSVKNTVTIQDIVSYLDKYYYENIKIEALAKKAGYTSRHFRTLFTENTGLPPSEYLLSKRLECSKRLLAASSMSIIEIAQSCGFSSASQFALLFKRYTCLTPSDYRNSCSKKRAN